MIAALMALGVAAAGCSISAGELAGETENRVTFDELTDAVLDPESDLVFEDVDGIDLEEHAPTSESFCEAFGAVPVTWVDDALLPIQMFVDAWEPVDDAPAAVRTDVDEVRRFGERKLDWHFGRIDREDRPVDPLLFERLERIADAAVAECDDLPVRIGYPADWALQREWEPGEVERRCEQSLADVNEGLPLYRELRGREPDHPIQIELASLAEWTRRVGSADQPPLWFVPELHGLDRSDGTARIIALAPCDDA